MKKILILLLVLLPIFAFSQKWDIDLGRDKIENETTEPSAYDMNVGNYAPTVLNIDSYYSQIANRLKRKVVIFFHDTAGEYDHDDLKKVARNDLGAVFTDETAPYDGNSHSTHAAGCAVAYNEKMALGTAAILNKYGFVEVVPVKELRNDGRGSFQWVRDGVGYAIEKGKELQAQGYFVIHNLSLGGSTDYQPLADVIQAGRNEGQFFAIAAGNSGGTPVGFPGRANGADAIAATDQNNQRANFSSYGKEVFIGGPGVAILSTLPGGGYGKKSGTSMACPSIAGVVAILASMNPSATANQIEQMLAKNATDIYPDGRDEFTGFGVPVFGDWIFEDATKYPDIPVGEQIPPDDHQPKHREKRRVNLVFDGYSMLWKRLSDAKLKSIDVSFELHVTTDLYDEDIYKEVKEDIDKYFSNRAVVIRDQDGFVDATYWTGYFLELIISKQMDPSYQFSIFNINGQSDAKECHVFGSTIHRKILKKKLKKQPVGKAYFFELE